MTDSTDEAGPECRQCGDPVGSSPEQRVITTVEDGTAVYKRFCDDDCRERWDTSA
ncbi:hypothetical protein [Natrinema sp. 74]|uniref:DUF7576 family protein n=1 Tax=Natrinema sp. 74 TaxID=3384159 RepID=UPI0038D405CA